MVQVRPLAQLSTAVQPEQVVSLVPEQPPEAYCPAAQVEQVVQLEVVPPTRKLPALQLEHCESPAPVQVTPLEQPATAVQAVQLLPFG